MRENKHFLIGLLLGGVAAGVGALLLAPKSGKELYSDIADSYHNLSEKTGNLKDEIKHKGWHVLHPGEACSTCDGNGASYFAVGAVAGAIIGIASALFLAPKSGVKLREDIGNTYHNIIDQGEEWKDSIGEFVHHLKAAITKPGKNSSSLDNVLQLVNVGFQVWQNLQKRN